MHISQENHSFCTRRVELVLVHAYSFVPCHNIIMPCHNIIMPCHNIIMIGETAHLYDFTVIM